jgi:hypothetical protein
VGLLLFFLLPQEIYSNEDKVSHVTAENVQHWTWAPKHNMVIGLSRADSTLSGFSFSGKEVFKKSVGKYCDQVEVVGDSIVVASLPNRARQGALGGYGRSSGRSRGGGKGSKELLPDSFHIIPIDDPGDLKTVELDRPVGFFFLDPERTDRIHFLHNDRRNRFIGTLILASGKVTWEQYEGEDKNRRKVQKLVPFSIVGPNGPVAATKGSNVAQKRLKAVKPLVVDRNPSTSKQQSFGSGGFSLNSLNRGTNYISGDARLLSNGLFVIDNQSMAEVFQFPASKKSSSKPRNSRRNIGLGSSMGASESKPKTVRGPVAFHDTYDIVAYAAYDKLKFYSLSNRRLLRSWAFSELSDVNTFNLTSPKIVRLEGDRAFVGYVNNAFVVDLKDAFENGLEKRSRLPVIAPQTLQCGNAFEMDLNKLVTGKASFKLKAQPKGMRINNGVVRWTPDENKSGVFNATVVMTSDGKSDKANVRFIVKPRFCEIGFVPDGVQFDRSGDRAVCWAGREICIVDTRTLKVITKTGLGSSVKQASLENNHCYIKVESSRAINRFDARNFRKDPLRIQETEESKLDSISPFALSGIERHLKRIDETYWSDQSTIRTLRKDKLVAIVEAGDLPVIPKKDPIAHQLATTRRKADFATSSRFDLKKTAYPWKITAKTVDLRNVRSLDSWLNFQSTVPTVDGTQQAENQVWLGRFPRDNSDRSRLFLLGDRVIVFYRKRVFSVSLPPHDGPGKFQLRWPDFEPLSADENVEIKIPATGGKGKYRFAMKHNVVGLTLHPTNGTLRVEGPRLWQANLHSNDQHRMLSAASDRSDKKLLNWKRQFTKRYQKTTGFRLPKGKLPALIPVQIVANDEDGQRDEIQFYLLMHGDPIPQPDVVSKRIQDNIEKKKRKSVQLQRRLDSVEQSFNASIRSLSIIESLLQQKLNRLKEDKKEREEPGQKKTD